MHICTPVLRLIAEGIQYIGGTINRNTEMSTDHSNGGTHIKHYLKHSRER